MDQDPSRFKGNIPAEVMLTSADFPTPRLAIQGNVTLGDVDWFAAEQAQAANAAVESLETNLHNQADGTDTRSTAAIFEASHDEIVGWRSTVAQAHERKSAGTEIVTPPERFMVPITDDSPNLDRIGSFGRLRGGSPVWNPDTNSFEGGTDTPASDLMQEVGEWVDNRFDREGEAGDVLQNQFALPDGRVVNGNLLVRGETATQEAEDLAARVAARLNKDPSELHFETGGVVMYTKTGTEADRQAIRETLYSYLGYLEEAHSKDGRKIGVDEWADVAYMLYQSPINKKGSDAVNRVYLMTLAGHMMDSAPKMPDDIDLRAYTKGHDQFVGEIVALNA